MRLLVLLTKADKLARGPAVRALQDAQAVLAETLPQQADAGVCLFSALTRIGVEEVALHLRAWAQGAAANATAPQTTT